MSGVLNEDDENERRWKKLISEQVKVNIVYREEKKDYCTGADCILLDDFQKNIKEWESMDGTGIWYKDAASATAKLRMLGIL